MSKRSLRICEAAGVILLLLAICWLSYKSYSQTAIDKNCLSENAIKEINLYYVRAIDCKAQKKTTNNAEDIKNFIEIMRDNIDLSYKIDPVPIKYGAGTIIIEVQSKNGTASIFRVNNIVNDNETQPYSNLTVGQDVYVVRGNDFYVFWEGVDSHIENYSILEVPNG